MQEKGVHKTVDKSSRLDAHTKLSNMNSSQEKQSLNLTRGGKCDQT